MHLLRRYCCCSVTQLCPTLCDPMDCSTPGLPVLFYLPELLKLMSIESVKPSNHLILCHLLLLLPSIFSSIRVFSNKLALHIRQPKYWRFSFNISLSIGYSGLILFRIDWFDLLAVQGTLKNLLQHHSSKTSILQCCFLYESTLTSIHDYWKKHSFDYMDFFFKVMSLLFNMVSRFVIAFLPRSKQLFISWLQLLSTMILETKKIKSHYFHCFPIYLPWNDGTRCYDLIFLNIEF